MTKSACALAALTLFAACGLFKNQREVYDDAKPAAAPLRAKVVAAAALVDKRPPVPSSSTCKAPKKLTFDPTSDAHDTDYMMLSEAARGFTKPDDKHPDEDLDLHFGGPFPIVMRGTSTPRYFDDYMLRDPATEAVKDRIKRGLNVKNVVIVRERLGSLEYFLVDLAPATPAIVCAGTITPTADPTLAGAHTQELTIVTKNKRTGKEISRQTTTTSSDPHHAALWADARAQLSIHMQKELGLGFDD